jgi:glycosyltransferase involved in cell wall biosynthesis
MKSNKTLNILMILSNPFMVDPRVFKEAKALVREGHNLTIIIWDRKQDYSPQEIIEGITILRIHNTRLMKILPNDLYRNPFWWRKAYKRGLELYKNSPFDIVHCHDLDTLQTGVWLKKKFGIKLVYDAHEIFSYMMQGTAPNIAIKYAQRLEKRLIQYVDHIITVDDGYAEYFNAITNKPLTIIMNCKDLIGKYTSPTRKTFSLVYIGVLLPRRFFPDMIHVVKEIDNIKLVLAAKKEGLYNDMISLLENTKNVEFIGTIPFDQVIPITKGCHCIVCFFDPNYKLNKIGSPNKLFEAMVTGRPIIVSKGTRSGEITEKENCGLVINYTKEALREAIVKLRDSPDLCEEMGQNALNSAINKYNWEFEEKKLIKLYKEI